MNKLNISFDCFLDTVVLIHKNHKELRYGQSLMNHLYLVWPEKYNEISGTDDDCFYNDAKAPQIMQKLREDWGKR